MGEKPKVSVSVFSDYICPFCYIGDRRLARLADHFDLAVDWHFLEIHPDTPSSGMPVSELGYPEEQWRQMMEHLTRMAGEENIPLAERKITTNSHKALLLAEAAKGEGADVFSALNEKLFAAFFGEGRNIGDDSVLRTLAEEAGVAPDVVERAGLRGNAELEPGGCRPARHHGGSLLSHRKPDSRGRGARGNAFRSSPGGSSSPALT